MKSAILAAAAAATAMLGAAHAAQVIETQAQIMTEDGQDFSFIFDDINHESGTVGIFTIASGGSVSSPGLDGFDLDFSTEFFEATVDGLSAGTFNCTGNGGHDVIAGANAKTNTDCEFSLELTLNEAAMDALAADGTLDLMVLFSDGVNAFTDNDELVVTFEYTMAGMNEVPVPAAALLFAPALAGVALRRRRS
ncbi:MAG: hypothetical protein AAF830_14455 [Pseudomonadota bacterium]